MLLSLLIASKHPTKARLHILFSSFIRRYLGGAQNNACMEIAYTLLCSRIRLGAVDDTSLPPNNEKPTTQNERATMAVRLFYLAFITKHMKKRQCRVRHLDSLRIGGVRDG